MPVKDRIVNWWIQNIILPKREIIDKPGFVVTTFTEGTKTIYLRDYFLPEQLFELIESKIVEHYDNDGRQALYSAGKKFGYIYSSLSNFPTIQNSTNKAFSDFAYLLVRYLEGTYAKQAEYTIDLEKKLFTIFFDNYLICRHNGLGYIMADGGISGIWAYVMQDRTLEGIQLECQGRGDKKCVIFCGPEHEIKEKSETFLHETDLLERKFDISYKTMNEIRETTYSMNSLKSLIDAGFFDFHGGILSYKNNRFFHSDTHILDLLEQEISKLPNGQLVLFDACFDYGKLLRETYGGTNYKKFIPDFFSALGFGDILVLDTDKIRIVSKYYPWTIFSKQTRYIIFRGIMSGIVSSSLGKKIEFINYNVDIENYLTLTISV
jgi:hypothetical protein